MTRTTASPLSAMTLDEITNAHPETLEVFNRFAMDMCCGGGVPLAEAAERDGVDLKAVVAALRAAMDASAEGAR